ncbi:unnamed protein product [Ambrosiozyma monospora]|uniref:Unnamed protein product n=1 Tax=Ambrosiozyma monospora TaxID=43982 RepID=A0ACB5UB51_AMBMO|nr:unnamed protein product [Ambrosiozyma monospora]
MGFDRICRVFRISQNGFVNHVKIDIYGENLIKLEFIEPIGMGFHPGCYVYLHFLSLPFYVVWQSHPFSLVRSTASSDRLVLYLKCKKGITRKLLKLQNKGFIKVLVDGPYGKFPVDTRNDDGFDKVVGIGGGLALSSVLAFFNHRAAKFQEKSANERYTC